MNTKILSTKFFLAVLFAQIIFVTVSAQTASSPRAFSEIFVLRSMRQIHSAQVTYQATFGNGNFGPLQNLYQAGFIDEALASGSKYGYSYIVTVTPLIPGTTPSSFKVTATPRAYRKTGVRSFYIDVFGEMRGGDRNGQPATATDPFIDDCTNGSIVDNERCTIQDLRTLYAAEMTYAGTVGGGNYAFFQALYDLGLIRSDLTDYFSRGYIYWISYIDAVPNTNPASFYIRATPQTYGTSAIRSFYIDQTGVLRGADKQGQNADANDPPINE